MIPAEKGLSEKGRPLERELVEKNKELERELVLLQGRISNPLSGRKDREKFGAQADFIAGEIEKNSSMLKKLRSDREFAGAVGKIGNIIRLA